MSVTPSIRDQRRTKSEGRPTVDSLVQDVQLRIGVIEDFVHLCIESAVLVCEGLGQVLLVYTRIFQLIYGGNNGGQPTSPASTDNSRKPIHDPHTP